MNRIVILFFLFGICNFFYSNAQEECRDGTKYWPGGVEVRSKKGEVCFFSIEKPDTLPILNTKSNFKNSIALVECFLQFAVNKLTCEIEVVDLMITNIYVKDTVTEQDFTIFNEEIYKDNYFSDYGFLFDMSEMRNIEFSLKKNIEFWKFIPDDTTQTCIPNDMLKTPCLIQVVIN